MVGYPDILIATNTDGAHLGINLGPNVDFALNESTTINAGVIIGLRATRRPTISVWSQLRSSACKVKGLLPARSALLENQRGRLPCGGPVFSRSTVSGFTPGRNVGCRIRRW